MAALLLAAGAKGKRFALPNSRILIHQPSGGAQGQATDVRIQAEEIIRMRELTSNILGEAHGPAYTIRLSATLSVIALCRRSQAKEYGLLDQAIAHRE
ncbi:MAG: ATP-dependent Clp protease proteolytic subunit [Pyrinomonadaceae bacterium]